MSVYIDKFISCSLDVCEEEKQYVQLQLHRHSRTCRKRGAAICRFNYPIPPFPVTCILGPLKDVQNVDQDNFKRIQTLLNTITDDNMTFPMLLDKLKLTPHQYERAVRSSLKTPKVFLKRKPSESRVNMYMRNLLPVWQANMDCLFCLDAYSVVVYIVNYINKQARGLSLSLREVMKECQKNKTDIRNSVKTLCSR